MLLLEGPCSLSAALAEEWQQRAAPHPAASDLASDDDPIVDKRLRDLGYY